MTKIKAVAWDLDGTLANSEALAMPAAVDSAADYVQQKKPYISIDQDARDLYVQVLMGKTIMEIGEAVGKDHGVEMPHNLQQIVTQDTIATLAKKCQPLPAAHITVLAVQQAGLNQWIATSSAPERVVVTLQATALDKSFPIEEEHWFSAKITKPDPEVYLRSIQKKGHIPAEVLAVEDSPTGVAAAKNAGVGYIVGITAAAHIPIERKEKHAQILRDAGADFVITSLEDLPRLIQDLNQSPRPPKPRTQELPSRLTT